jgi:small subunit ribosomal protein S7|tara:strand:+ start:54 stop:518 length:465 start_codon:yes stop_codon:yes gene_type:complete
MIKVKNVSSGANSEYFNIIFSKLLNLIMNGGKKNVAYKIVNKSILLASSQLNLSNSSELLTKATFNASPDLEIKSKRVGTGVYQVPKAIDMNKKLTLGLKNILDACKVRKEYTMLERLSGELVDAYNNKGIAVKKKEEIHKLAEANKSFAHFNW